MVGADASPGHPRFVALAGFGCPNRVNATFTMHGWYTHQNPDSGFFIRYDGGWGNNGCSGSFADMPMDGDASSWNAQTYGSWWFNTAPVTSGSCSVSVYVPDDNGTPYTVAGDPAFYLVRDGDAERDGSLVGEFTVNQTTGRGSWHEVTQRFPVTNGQLFVELTDRGTGHVTNPYAHLAMAPVSVDCAAG
jgi:hypothetical protein